MSGTRPLWWRHSLSQPATGRASRLVVVTDIDSSLLEPGNSSAPVERAAIDFLAALGIPLVINSSRTRAEIERVHRRLRMLTPFISEHGSALFVPHGSFPFAAEQSQPAVGGDVIEFGRRYHEVVEALRMMSEQLDVQIVSFAELTIEDVARELDVPIVEAQLAKLREYSELFRIVNATDATKSGLIKLLRRRGLRCWQAGSHLLATATPDRTESLRMLKSLWTRAWGEPIVVGFGDSDDDVAWLRHVDVAVVVESASTGVPSRVLSKLPTVHVTRRPGRAGWSEAILEHVGDLLRGHQGTKSWNAFQAVSLAPDGHRQAP